MKQKMNWYIFLMPLGMIYLSVGISIYFWTPVPHIVNWQGIGTMFVIAGLILTLLGYKLGSSKKGKP